MSETKSEKNGVTVTTDDAITEDTASVVSMAQLEAIAEERDRLAAANSELNDRLLRRTAEFDNFRKRSEKERQELYEYAAIEPVGALLPVLDDFERALKVETADKEYARGMELIYQRTFESLKRLGLEPVEAAGKPFDPHLHHGVEMVETTQAADHTVLADLQRGFKFKGRLLRPSMVKVAVTPSTTGNDPQ